MGKQNKSRAAGLQLVFIISHLSRAVNKSRHTSGFIQTKVRKQTTNGTHAPFERGKRWVTLRESNRTSHGVYGNHLQCQCGTYSEQRIFFRLSGPNRLVSEVRRGRNVPRARRWRRGWRCFMVDVMGRDG